MTVLHSFSALAGTSERQVDEAVVWFQVQCLVSDPACHFLRHIVSYHSECGPWVRRGPVSPKASQNPRE